MHTEFSRNSSQYKRNRSYQCLLNKEDLLLDAAGVDWGREGGSRKASLTMTDF